MKTAINFKRYIKNDPSQIREIGFHVNGTKYWLLNGHNHREDGPAIERSDGSKEWWLNGRQHREDGPAIEWSDGDKEWCLNGKLHREDGPAIESNGTKQWFLNGNRFLSEIDYWEVVEKYKKNRKNTK